MKIALDIFVNELTPIQEQKFLKILIVIFLLDLIV